MFWEKWKNTDTSVHKKYPADARGSVFRMVIKDLCGAPNKMAENNYEKCPDCKEDYRDCGKNSPRWVYTIISWSAISNFLFQHGGRANPTGNMIS